MGSKIKIDKNKKVDLNEIENDLRKQNKENYLKNHHDLRRAYLKLDKQYKRSNIAKIATLAGSLVLLPVGIALSAVNPALGYAAVAAQVAIVGGFAKSMATYHYCESQLEKVDFLAENSMNRLKYEGLDKQYWDEYREEQELG